MFKRKGWAVGVAVLAVVVGGGRFVLFFSRGRQSRPAVRGIIDAPTLAEH